MLSNHFKQVLDVLKHSPGFGHPSDRYFAVDAFCYLFNRGEQGDFDEICHHLQSRGWDKVTALAAASIWETVTDVLEMQSGMRTPSFTPSNLRPS